MTLSKDQEARVNAAIADAERTTTGEIFCIYAREVGQYWEVALGWCAGVALLLPLALLPLGFHPWALDEILAGWRIGGAGPSAMTGALAYAGMQTVLFLLALAVMTFRPVRYRLTPEPLKRAAVHRAALQQFLAKGLHQTEARTGVLIFAAAAERHAEVIADEGVYRKVEPDVWGEALEALGRGMKRGEPAEGFEQAVRLCGAVLAQHFPASGENPNELPDEIVQL